MNVVFIDTPSQIDAGLSIFSKLENARILTTDPRTLFELENGGYSVETFDSVYEEVALHEQIYEWLPELWVLFRRLDDQLQECLQPLFQYNLRPIEKLGNTLILKLTNYAAALYICAAFLEKYGSCKIYLPDLTNYGLAHSIFDTWQDRNPHFIWAFQNLIEDTETYEWPKPIFQNLKPALIDLLKMRIKHASAKFKFCIAGKRNFFLDLDEGELSRRIAEIDPRGHVSFDRLKTLIPPSEPITEMVNWPGEILGPVFMGKNIGALIVRDLNRFRNHILPELFGLISWVEHHPSWLKRLSGLVCNRSLADSRLAMFAEYFCAKGVRLLHYQHGGGYGALDMPKFITSDFTAILDNHVFCVWGPAVTNYSKKLKLPTVSCTAVGWKSLSKKVKVPSGELNHILYVPTSMRYNGAGIRAYPYGDFPCTGYFLMQRRLIDAIAATGYRDLVLKMHPGDKPVAPIHRHIEHRGYPFIVDYDSKLINYLTPSTLVITDFTSTTYCEALALGCTIIAYQHEATLKPMPAALAIMHQSSYVYECFDEFVEAAVHATQRAKDFPPKDNCRYLHNYVFVDDGDEALANALNTLIHARS